MRCNISGENEIPGVGTYGSATVDLISGLSVAQIQLAPAFARRAVAEKSIRPCRFIFSTATHDYLAGSTLLETSGALLKNNTPRDFYLILVAAKWSQFLRRDNSCTSAWTNKLLHLEH